MEIKKEDKHNIRVFILGAIAVVAISASLVFSFKYYKLREAYHKCEKSKIWYCKEYWKKKSCY